VLLSQKLQQINSKTKFTKKSKNYNCQHNKYEVWLPLYATCVPLFSTPAAPTSSLSRSFSRAYIITLIPHLSHTHCNNFEFQIPTSVIHTTAFSNFKFTILIPHLSHIPLSPTPLSHSHSAS